jgi:hypothetical protein
MAPDTETAAKGAELVHHSYTNAARFPVVPGYCLSAYSAYLRDFCNNHIQPEMERFFLVAGAGVSGSSPLVGSTDASTSYSVTGSDTETTFLQAKQVISNPSIHVAA